MNEHEQKNMAEDAQAAAHESATGTGAKSTGAASEATDVEPMGELNTAKDSESTGVTPRPMWQRVLAWAGIVYTILAMLLLSAFMMRGDYLRSIGWLMIVPILVAAAVFIPLTYSKGKGRGGMPMLFVSEVALLYLIYTALVEGIPALIAQFS